MFNDDSTYQATYSGGTAAVVWDLRLQTFTNLPEPDITPLGWPDAQLLPAPRVHVDNFPFVKTPRTLEPLTPRLRVVRAARRGLGIKNFHKEN